MAKIKLKHVLYTILVLLLFAVLGVGAYFYYLFEGLGNSMNSYSSNEQKHSLEEQKANVLILEKDLQKLPSLEEHWVVVKKDFEDLKENIRLAFPERKWEDTKTEKPDINGDALFTGNKDFYIGGTYTCASNYYLTDTIMEVRDFKDADYEKLFRVVSNFLKSKGYSKYNNQDIGLTLSNTYKEGSETEGKYIFTWDYYSTPAVPNETRWRSSDKISVGAHNFLNIGIDTGLYLQNVCKD